MKTMLWDKTLSWNAWFRDTTTLPRMKSAGYSVVGLTIGGGSSGMSFAEESLAAVHRMVDDEPSQYRIVRDIRDVDAARSNGQLALEFNFQGADPFGDRLVDIERVHALGVRQIGLVWNADNLLGCSATSRSDSGLTEFGRKFIREMNRAGMIVDGTHAGYRTTLDAIDASEHPTIFSHSNVDALSASYKNLKDDQIRFCAQRGGVIGISGFGTYLDDLQASAASMFRQIDHVCQLVGAAHVALGLDFVSKPDALWEKVRANPDLWPGVSESRFFPPEEVVLLRDLMERAGYRDEQVAGVLGENWRRVSHDIWSRRKAPESDRG